MRPVALVAGGSWLVLTTLVLSVLLEVVGQLELGKVDGPVDERLVAVEAIPGGLIDAGSRHLLIVAHMVQQGTMASLAGNLLMLTPAHLVGDLLVA